jgi:hypothetical protein
MKKILFLSAMLIGMISFAMTDPPEMTMVEKNEIAATEAVFFDSGGGSPDPSSTAWIQKTSLEESDIEVAKEESTTSTADIPKDVGWNISSSTSSTNAKDAACQKMSSSQLTSSFREGNSRWLSLNKKVTTHEESDANKKESTTSGGWTYQNKAIIKSEHIQFG